MKYILLIFVFLSSCARNISKRNETTSPTSVKQPLTGDVSEVVHGTAQTQTVNDVFTWGVVTLVSLCFICTIPVMINRLKAKKNQSQDDSQRVVLND